MTDLKWWSGLTMGEVRRALSALALEEVDLDGVPGIVLADDLVPTEPPEPWVALLPSLDATTMGWKQRARGRRMDATQERRDRGPPAR